MSKSKIILTIAILFCVAFSLFSFVPVLAGSTVGDVHLINPLGGTETNTVGNVDLDILLGEIVARILMILGSITLLVFVIGGFLWLTSAGNQEKIKLGANTMFYAVIGLFVIFSSYAILNMILGTITENSVSGVKSSEPAPSKVKVEDSETVSEVGTCWYFLDLTKDDIECNESMLKENCDKGIFYPEGTKCSDIRATGKCVFPLENNLCIENERAFCEGRALSKEPPLNIKNLREYIWEVGGTCP